MRIFAARTHIRTRMSTSVGRWRTFAKPSPAKDTANYKNPPPVFF